MVIVKPEQEIDPPEMSKEEQRHLKEFVNSEFYPDLRAFLVGYIVNFYREGRRYKDEKTHIFNAIGMELENMVKTLDLLKIKPKQPSQEDSYVI